MNCFTKAKIYVEAKLSQMSGMLIKDLIETKIPVLDQNAPEGRAPYYYSVQDDGSLTKTELTQSEDSISDELELRRRMGDTYANQHQQKAAWNQEEISREEMKFRDLNDAIQIPGDKRIELIGNTGDYHIARDEAFRNRLIVSLIALGEIGIMLPFFADLFGLDSMKIVSEAKKYPFIFLTALFASASYFIANLWLAAKALHSTHRWFWAICLIGINVLIGQMRFIQLQARLDADINNWVMPLFFTIMGILLPIVGAYYRRQWKEASQVVGSTDSFLRRQNDQEAEYVVRLEKANSARTEHIGQLDRLTQEYVEFYQKALDKQERLKRDWETHQRYVEAYVAEMRYAYNFWSGSRAQGASLPKHLKRSLQVTGMILLALIFTLSGCNKVHAESGFNLITLCDRSSSAGEISCTKDILRAAGNYWISKADEAGGGVFEVLMIDQGLDTTTVLFSETYPERFPGPVSVHKKRWKNNVLKKLSVATDSLPTILGSAIVEAIYRSSLRIPVRGETLLYILSDLRQQNRDYNFEKTVPEEREFIRWLGKNMIRPVFKPSVQILACGVHPYSPQQTTRMTTENYDRLLKLWRAVFAQWGVKASITEACNLKTNE